MQDIHVIAISFWQSDLRQKIVISLTEYELYVQLKGKLQQHNLEKIYEGYHLEEDGLFVYKNRIYIPNVVDLRKTGMDEIHKMPYSAHP